MAAGNSGQPLRRSARLAGLVAAVAGGATLGGCTQLGEELGSGLFAGLDASAPGVAVPQEPQKAVEHWGKAYAQDPRDLDKALSYAQALKATGQKSQALAVLQQASFIHGADRRLASDYGRLALELDQVSLAKRLLEVADDPANPDWRVILARGTVLAKEAKYRDAISYYERALALAPDHPSVMNNLALAYTMSGEPSKAEGLLRRAALADGANTKVLQNLTLVLGLQGKYEEATQVASAGGAETAHANTEIVRKMVKLAPQPAKGGQAAPESAAVAAAWITDVTEARKPAPHLKRAAADKDDAGTPAKPAVVAAQDSPFFKPSAR